MSGQTDLLYWLNKDRFDEQDEELLYATRQELLEYGVIDNREEYEQ